jgi:hypothetical protein
VSAAVVLPGDLSETDWLAWVLDVAQLHGWRVAHHRPARTANGWRTPMQGNSGVPDLLLGRNGDVLLAELKANRGQIRPEQRAWLAHLGDHGRVWRPRDAEAVLARLERPAVEVDAYTEAADCGLSFRVRTRSTAEMAADVMKRAVHGA